MNADSMRLIESQSKKKEHRMKAKER